MTSSQIETETEPRTYRASGFWGVALWICSGLFGIGGAACVWYGVGGDLADVTGRVLVCCFGVLFFALGAYELLWLYKSRVFLFRDRISFQRVASTKTFTREELRGWRILPSSPPTLVLEFKDRSRRKFKTGLVFPLDDPFSEWLDSLPSLDLEDAETSASDLKNEMDDNQRLGVTASEKAESLSKIRSQIKVLTIVSVGAFVWGFFYPKFYEALILLLIVLPWVGVEIMRRSHGLVRADQLRNDKHPNVAYALLMPAIALGLRAVLDYNVVYSTLAVVLYVVAGAVFVAVVLRLDATEGRNTTVGVKAGTILGFLFVGLSYGYGSVTEANALLDRSPGVGYSATVQGKQVVTGKTTTYELKLSAWGPMKAANEFDVSQATYSQIEVGDVVSLNLKEGALGLKWYYLQDWERGDSKTPNQ